MPRGRNGWADIIGDSQDVATRDDSAERTDPNLALPDFDTPVERAPSAVTSDPVLAAMAELDGLKNIPDDALSAASRTEREPTPAVGFDSAALSDAPTELGEQPTLQDDGPRLSLPIPGGAGGKKATKPIGVAPVVEDAFAELEPPSTDSRIDLEAEGIWTTYREVIIAAIAGFVLLIGAVIYTTTRPEAAQSIVANKPPPMLPPPVASKKPAEPKPKPVQAKPTEKVAAKAATPMLTILSVPSGALVEINGAVYGKAPLIMPAPAQLSALEVVLKLDGYRKWSKQIHPNDAGHFSERAKLVPLR